MPDTRLIERWLPIAEIGEESTRESRSMTALPPTYYLHVWWARRPLVASRAAILASLLPEDADRDRFLHVIGIHGDPLAAKRRIAAADRAGERLGAPMPTDTRGRSATRRRIGTGNGWRSTASTRLPFSIRPPAGAAFRSSRFVSDASRRPTT